MSLRSKIAGIALSLSILVPVWFVVATLGVKFGLWPWRFGLGVMIVQWGPRLLIATAVIAFIVLITVLVRKPRRGWTVALIALIIPALGLGYMTWIKTRSADIPPIHDVSTDIGNPPVPSQNLLALRTSGDANPVLAMSAPLTAAKAYQGERFVRFGNKSLGQIGQAAYPALQTLERPVAPAVAFAAAREVAKDMGWIVVTDDATNGSLEATAQTFWFGFKDDIIIRVQPVNGGQGSRIDVRSISRVGLSDLGANAKRIDAFLSQLSSRLQN